MNFWSVGIRDEGVGSKVEEGVKRVLSTRAAQILRRNVRRFRGGLVFEAHRLVHHSTLGLIIIKKKKGCGQHLIV